MEQRTPIAERCARHRQRHAAGLVSLAVDADPAALASVLRVRGLLPADVQPSRQALAKFASLLLAEIALNPEVAQLNTTADYPAAVTDRAAETIAHTCDALQDAGVAAGHVPFALFSASVAMLNGNMCAYHYRAALEELHPCIVQQLEQTQAGTCGHVH